MAEYRAGKSGISADIKKKRDADYQSQKEDEDTVKEWIELVLDMKFAHPFFEELHDGSILCQLLNKLIPGALPKKFEKPSSMVFKQMEAIGKFIEGCNNKGMTMFVTLDLYEQQNRNMVLSSLISLGRTAQKFGYEGPILGAEPNPIQLTEEQLQEGKNI